MLSDELTQLKKDSGGMLDQMQRIKLENKDLQSESILLATQLAALEKIVHAYQMNAKTSPTTIPSKNYDDKPLDMSNPF